MKEAKFYLQLENQSVKCCLCPRECVIQQGNIGFCKGKENKNGKIYARNYGYYTGISLDPIEKKPLYHFYPRTFILSLGPNGCNLGCKFCQNWTISQKECVVEFISPEELVKNALKTNSIGIAYTYSEPVIWYEFILDTAKLAHEKGLKNVLVTNGFINEIPLKEILPLIDAFNIDLKSMENDFYEKICYGQLEPILKTIKIVNESKSHLELTNLVIPELNDSIENIEKLINWVDNLNSKIPVHFSRYFPCYQINLPPTPLKTLFKIYEMACKKLDYVYLGNIGNENFNSTYCPNCKKKVIIRKGYQITNILKNNQCPFCKKEIKIIF